MGLPYFNPQEALPDPSVYNVHGPFGMSAPTALTYKAAADRRETMAPFVQRAGLADQLALQKQQQETSEFTSPEAIGARMSGFQKEAAENQQATLNAPVLGEKTRKQAQADTSLIGAKTYAERLKIRNATIDAQDEPTQYASRLMAANYESMRDAKSETERMAIHKATIQRFKDRYKDVPVPPQLEGWHPDMLQMYHAMNNVANMTPEYFTERMKQQSATERTKIEQAGATARGESQLDAAQTPERALQRAQAQLKVVKDPKAREALYQQIDAANDALTEADLSKRFEKRSPMGDMMLRLQAQSAAKQMNLSPEETQKAIDSAIPNWENARQAEKEKLMAQRGVTMSYLRRKNPGMSDTEIKASAGKRGIKIIE